jgi:hypothetical protein
VLLLFLRGARRRAGLRQAQPERSGFWLVNTPGPVPLLMLLIIVVALIVWLL